MIHVPLGKGPFESIAIMFHGVLEILETLGVDNLLMSDLLLDRHGILLQASLH